MKLSLLAFVLCVSAVLSSAADLGAKRAEYLAHAYFHHFVSGCGAVKTPALHGSRWFAPVLFGFGGTPRGYIKVDKHTGTVSYSWNGEVYPTVTADKLDALERSLEKHRTP